jgi:hypothetical protein
MNNQLCYITQDGRRVECMSVETFIPSLFHLLPLMAVRGLHERLNGINLILVPMGALHALDENAGG